MRGVTVTLPPEAKSRLDMLSIERESALDQMKALQSRINMADGDASIIERLTIERDKASLRQNTLHRLLSSVNQWLVTLRLPPAHYLEPVQMFVALPKGQTAAEAIVAVRALIAGINAQIAQVRSAPLTRQAQQDAVHRYLASLAMGSRPKITFDQQGNARIAWAEDIATMNSVVGLLALICPAELISSFQLDAGPEPENAVSPGQREARLGDLSAKLLELERRESALLCVAEGVLPRPEMNPQAYLQVRIATEVAQQVA
jgi:hypothetical protein